MTAAGAPFKVNEGSGSNQDTTPPAYWKPLPVFDKIRQPTGPQERRRGPGNLKKRMPIILVRRLKADLNKGKKR